MLVISFAKAQNLVILITGASENVSLMLKKCAC